MILLGHLSFWSSVITLFYVKAFCQISQFNIWNYSSLELFYSTS